MEGGRDEAGVREAVALLEQDGVCRVKAHALVNLLQDESNTIPFLCRYRIHVHGGVSPDLMRSARRELKQAIVLEAKKKSLWAKLTAAAPAQATARMRELLDLCSTEADCGLLIKPFLPASKTDQKSRILEASGLLLVVDKVWKGTARAGDVAECARRSSELRSQAEAEQLVVEALSVRVAALPPARNSLKRVLMRTGHLQTHAVKKRDPKADIMVHGRRVTADTFRSVTGRSIPLNRISPHTVLAVFRGEQAKLLRLTFEMPKHYAKDAHGYVLRAGIEGLQQSASPESRRLLNTAVRMSVEGPLWKSSVSEVKRQLKEVAATASVAVFASNIRGKLLTRGVGGRILGMDPGYRHGCKCCVIDETGTVMHTFTVFMHKKNSSSGMDTTQYDAAVQEVLDAVRRYRVSHFAVGNGCGWWEAQTVAAAAVREAQSVVDFTIVDEAGSSVYSVSKTGEADLPELDPSHRSAVSIARRLQDPMAELVKMEVKSMGVGMYQHSMTDKSLEQALEDTVADCVGCVGVDVNTASWHLLSRVAGLTTSVARAVVAHRSEHGPFRSKAELCKVTGLKARRYEQCAGFLRVPGAENELDRTHIHPESFDKADRVLGAARQMGGNPDANVVAKRLGLDAEEVRVLIKELRVLVSGVVQGYLSTPVMMRTMGGVGTGGLHTGAEVVGVVKNVTTFGVFVACGGEKDGLLHVSQLRGTVQIDGSGKGDKLDGGLLAAALAERFPIGGILPVRVQSVGPDGKVGLGLVDGAPDMTGMSQTGVRGGERSSKHKVCGGATGGSGQGAPGGQVQKLGQKRARSGPGRGRGRGRDGKFGSSMKKQRRGS